MPLSLILPSFRYSHALFTCLHHPPSSLIASTCTIHCFLPTRRILVTFPFSFNLPCLSLSCFFSWVLSSAFLPPLIIPLTTYRCIYSSRGTMHTGFHRFTEIGQIFHNKYIVNNKEHFPSWNLAHISSEWLRKLKMEINYPKTFLGEPSPWPPRSLRLWCLFRKLISIFPRSVPVCPFPFFLSFLSSISPFLTSFAWCALLPTSSFLLLLQLYHSILFCPIPTFSLLILSLPLSLTKILHFLYSIQMKNIKKRWKI